MSIRIPIVSDFDGRGIKRAIKEFKSLEGASAKAQFAIKKAAVPAAAALTGLTVAAVDFAKAAAEDQAAAGQLANQLKNSTKATDDQIQSVESWITATSMASAVADDELRPALAKLALGTGDLTKAQDLMQTVLDTAAATGLDAVSVADALSRGYNGNTKALGKLSPEIRKMVKQGASFDEVVTALNKNFKGANKTFADSAQGGFKKMGIALQETKESIGSALLPVVQAVIPYVQKFAQWAQENPQTFKIIAAALAGIAVAIMAINAAMALNPITAIALAIGAVIAGVVLAYKKFEGFRKIVDTAWAGIKLYFNGLKKFWGGVYDGFRFIFNGIADLWNNTVGKISFGIPDWVPVIGGKKFDVPDIPKLADGGIVNSPTLALIGERGPEAVVPLDRAGTMGANITVQTGVGDPVAIGKAVVDALAAYQRRVGALPLKVA